MHNDHVKRGLNIIKKVTIHLVAPRRKPVHQAKGQALVEYSLLTVLIAMALFAGITLTGPAIGNVFSNVLYTVQGGGTPYNTMTINDANNYGTAYATFAIWYTPNPFQTNTPAGPTCVGPNPSPQPTNTPKWQTAIPSNSTPKGVYIAC